MSNLQSIQDKIKKHPALRQTPDEIKSTEMTIDSFDLSVLTPKEEMYFRIMFARSGVLELVSEPGLAKSAILLSIANKLKLHFIDLRLTQIDETDLCLFPDKKIYDLGNGQSETFLSHLIPEWAWIANNPPAGCVGTLVNFEELNRAPLTVRNAALQLLLERAIGFTGFKFNDNVFMASTGNLGVEDDTDVEEFDAALKNRLIKVKHELPCKEWVETWANDNVHPLITSFLLGEGIEYYYFKPKKDQKSSRDNMLITPRSWTNYSNFLTKNFGKDCKFSTFKNTAMKVGHYIVGGIANNRFLQFCEDIDKITLQDILNRYSEVRIKTILNRSKRAELLEKLKKIKVKELNKTQSENVKLFLLDLRADEIAAYFYKLILDDYNSGDKIANSELLDFLKDSRFTHVIDTIDESLDNILEIK